MAGGRKDLIEALVREMPWFISASVRFQIAVAHQLGMPVADVHAIGALQEFGPIGVRRLAEVMGMTTGAVTRLVDRLERGGFVRREPDPADRRRVVLRVLRERVDEIYQYYESVDNRWQQQVNGFTDAELRFLLRFLRYGRENSQVGTEELRADGRTHGARRSPGQAPEPNSGTTRNSP